MNHSARARAIRLVALGAASLAVATALPASATVGALTPKVCFAEPGTANTDGCAAKAAGLYHPYDVASSADGKSVYVVGGSNGIAMFHRNRTTGALTYQDCIADSNSVDIGTCSQILPNGQYFEFLYGVAVSPDNKSVYAVSHTGNAMYRFRRDRRTGLLTYKDCIGESGQNDAGCGTTTAGLNGADRVVVSPDSTSVYVSSDTSNGVVAFSRNLTTGALSPIGCFVEAASTNDQSCTSIGTLDMASDLVVSPDGTSLYVLGWGDDTISIFDRAPDGTLTYLSCVAETSHNPKNCAATSPHLSLLEGIAISPDGGDVYVLAVGFNEVRRFTRDATTGALTHGGCIADASVTTTCKQQADGLYGDNDIAMSADGRSVYVTGGDSWTVAWLNRSLTTGQLAGRDCVTDDDSTFSTCSNNSRGLEMPWGVAVSSDGKSVYAIGYNSSSLVRMDRSLS